MKWGLWTFPIILNNMFYFEYNNLRGHKAHSKNIFWIIFYIFIYILPHYHGRTRDKQKQEVLLVSPQTVLAALADASALVT